MIGSLKPPGFWWKEAPSRAGGILAVALSPFAAAYGAIAARRMAQDGFRASVPVICVGNLTVGGAGKTPTVLALAKQLIAAGETPWILTRGYRSAAKHHGPIRVDSKTHRVPDVGDEALLLAAFAPTLSGANRVTAAKLAVAQGASLLLLDDGFQSPALAKDMRLVVVDAEAGIGNGLCLPAGPLRAPLEAQLDHADALILIGAGARGDRLAKLAHARGKPVFLAKIEMDASQAAAFAQRRVHAFAGIGRPEKFFGTLAEAGAVLVTTTEFPDHYAYRGDDILRLQRAAAADDALLVTTEKDFARLRPLENFIEAGLPVPLPIPVALRFAAPDALAALIGAAVARKRSTDPVSGQAFELHFGAGIGLLEIDVPIAQIVERDRRAGNGAAHIGAGLQHADFAVQKFDFGFSRGNRPTFKRFILSIHHRWNGWPKDNPGAAKCLSLTAHPASN